MVVRQKNNPVTKDRSNYRTLDAALQASLGFSKLLQASPGFSRQLLDKLHSTTIPASLQHRNSSPRFDLTATVVYHCTMMALPCGQDIYNEALWNSCDAVGILPKKTDIIGVVAGFWVMSCPEPIKTSELCWFNPLLPRRSPRADAERRRPRVHTQTHQSARTLAQRGVGRPPAMFFLSHSLPLPL